MPESVRSLVQRKIDALDDDRSATARCRQRPGRRFRLGDLSLASSNASRTRSRIALERLEREHALVRFVEEHETDNRELTLRYRFAHHVYHNAFDASLRATRRATLSRAIAQRLIGRLGGQPCDCAADIALLFESARDNVRAAEYWNRAAQASARLYAHDETERLALRGLALLEGEPDSTQKAAAELGLQMTYGLCMKTSRGYAVPEVGRAYARARELCHRIDDPARVVPCADRSVGASHRVWRNHDRRATSRWRCSSSSTGWAIPNLQMIGQWSLGAALFHLGELEVASRAPGAGDRAVSIPRFTSPASGRPGSIRASSAAASWRARCRCEAFRIKGCRCVQTAVAEARALEHPQPLAFALLFSTIIHLARREPAEVCRVFDELAALCRAHGIAQEMQWGAPLRGRALIELGQIEVEAWKNCKPALPRTRLPVRPPAPVLSGAAGGWIAARTAAGRGAQRRSPNRRNVRGRRPVSMRMMPRIDGCRQRSGWPRATTKAPNVPISNR